MLLLATATDHGVEATLFIELIIRVANHGGGVIGMPLIRRCDQIFHMRLREFVELLQKGFYRFDAARMMRVTGLLSG